MNWPQMTNLDAPGAMDTGLAYLCALDPHLQSLAARNGPPPLWQRPPGFPTLVHIILEQQVSLASARSAFNRLLQASPQLTPGNFLQFDDAQLKAIGFSRQKTSYCRGLASAMLRGELELDNLPGLPDDQIRQILLRIKGIGPWTVDIYLLMVLLRSDSWPAGDLALAVALQETRELSSRPTPAELEKIAEPWRPWRALAARLLWHAYLLKRGLA